MTFKEKLVILRKIRKITQDELASAVGVSRQAVYKWECGQSYPEVPKLLEIKFLFGISIDDLLDDSFEIALPEKKRKRRAKAANTAVAEETEKPVFVPAVAKVEEVEEVVAEPEVVEEEKAEEPVLVAAAPAEEVKEAETVEANVEEPAEQAALADETAPEKKKGFFGRLFGKK